MTTLQALILGIIQGITEFLPISSSGHLKIAQILLGLKELDKLILFDLACHLGTLLSIACIFKNEIIDLFKDRQRLGQISLAIAPLFPLLLLIKPIKHLFNEPQYLGFFFLTTACLLTLGVVFASSRKSKTPYRDALVIGSFQALAILPGVSRSGSTISGARLLGWTQQEALTFSFLLAIPTILGGIVVETASLITSKEALPAIPASHYLIGIATSFLVGLITLHLLKTLARNQTFLYFAVYCLIIGIGSLLAF